MSLSHVSLIAAFVLLGSAMAADASLFTVTLTSPSRVQGSVTAGGLRWLCRKDTCTAMGPASAGSVETCAELARQTGDVAAFVWRKQQLSTSELEACNAKKEAQRFPQPGKLKRFPFPPFGKQEPAPPRKKDAVTGEQKSVRTITLTITGTGTIGNSVAAPQRSVRTTTLTITGTGALTAPAGASAPARTVRTPPLTVTGTGHL